MAGFFTLDFKIVEFCVVLGDFDNGKGNRENYLEMWDNDLLLKILEEKWMD